MKYPQTKAELLAKNIQAIADNGCLAMCYLYCIGLVDSEYNIIGILSEAMDMGLLEKDCFVSDADKFLNAYCGANKVKVIKKDITSLEEITGDFTPVRFDYNGKNHWVVVENGRIVFNPRMYSKCVNFGRPTTARIITFEKRV